ncbi:MAG: hypothetical protein ABIQ84_09425, partial [Usitatibacter sp.]
MKRCGMASISSRHAGSGAPPATIGQSAERELDAIALEAIRSSADRCEDLPGGARPRPSAAERAQGVQVRL